MAGLMKPVNKCYIRHKGTISEQLMSRGDYAPTGLLPRVMRASLMSVIIDAVVGADADVPNTRLNSPSIAIT